MKYIIIILTALLLSINSYAEQGFPKITSKPVKYLLNLNKNEKAQFILESDLKEPSDQEQLFKAITKIKLHIAKFGNQTPILTKEFNSGNEFMNAVFPLKETGSYNAFLNIELASGFDFDTSNIFKVINIDADMLEPVTMEYPENGELVIKIPLPEIIVKALDLTYIIDGSGSMKDIIDTTKQSSKKIFDELHKLTSNVRASAVIMSDFTIDAGTSQLIPAGYNKIFISSENINDFNQIPSETEGGAEFQHVALLKSAKEKEFWRKDALKLMLLFTDEPDNAYGKDKDTGCVKLDNNKKIKWQNFGNISINDIASQIYDESIAVAIMYRDINPNVCYGALQRTLKDFFAGFYGISGKDTANMTRSIYNALKTLVSNTNLHMNIDDDSGIVASVTPESPAQCIVNGNSFSYICAKQKKPELEFKIKLKKINAEDRLKKYSFVLNFSTDKDSLISVLPVTIVMKH